MEQTLLGENNPETSCLNKIKVYGRVGLKISAVLLLFYGLMAALFKLWYAITQVVLSSNT